MLPDSFRSALEILSALDRENCNNICGGKKTVMCDTVVELGKAFLMDKSNIKGTCQSNLLKSNTIIPPKFGALCNFAIIVALTCTSRVCQWPGKGTGFVYCFFLQ